jgi:hypothetical protein
MPFGLAFSFHPAGLVRDPVLVRVRYAALRREINAGGRRGGGGAARPAPPGGGGGGGRAAPRRCGGQSPPHDTVDQTKGGCVAQSVSGNANPPGANFGLSSD